MRRAAFTRISLLLLFVSTPALHSQLGTPTEEQRRIPPDEVRLPNGKLQQDEILKLDYSKSLDDAKQLVQLSQDLQKDLQASGANVLSIADIHKTEEIEKLAKRIRSRIRRS